MTGPDDIKREVDKLYALEHFGKQLKDATKTVDDIRQKTRHEVVFVPSQVDQVTNDEPPNDVQMITRELPGDVQSPTRGLRGYLGF